MKVYIVWTGVSYDWVIDKIFKSKESAEQYIVDKLDDGWARHIEEKELED